eukprot:gene18282-biopygen870
MARAWRGRGAGVARAIATSGFRWRGRGAGMARTWSVAPAGSPQREQQRRHDRRRCRHRPHKHRSNRRTSEAEKRMKLVPFHPKMVNFHPEVPNIWSKQHHFLFDEWETLQQRATTATTAGSAWPARRIRP